MDDAETTAAVPAAAPVVPNARVAPVAPVRDAQWRWEPRVLVVDDDPVCQLAGGRGHLALT